MKIVYIPGYRYPASLEEPLTSGDLRYSFTLSRALAKLGHEVHVISRKKSHDKDNSVVGGVHVHRYKSEFEKIFSTSFDISLRRKRLFKKLVQDADVIICNSPLSLEHFVKTKLPIIYVASGLEDVKNYSFKLKEIAGFLAIKILRDPMKRLTWKKSTLVNTTAWHEDETLKKWGLPEEKIGTISSGVDTSRFKPHKMQALKLRKKLKLNSGEKIIMSISRFTPAKAVIETIQGFEELSRSDTKLVIIGVQHSHDTSYYTNVVDYIASSPKKDQIIVLENIADSQLPGYYSAADITSVFSKGYDPLPTTIIESMACGTPVVSTYYKTREQFIEDGVSGLFVKEKDIKDWVVKVSKLLDNESLRNQLSKAGLHNVREKFDSIEIAKKYIRTIENE